MGSCFYIKFSNFCNYLHVLTCELSRFCWRQKMYSICPFVTLSSVLPEVFNTGNWMIRCNRALPVETCLFGLMRALAVFSCRLMAFVAVMFACVPKKIIHLKWIMKNLSIAIESFQSRSQFCLTLILPFLKCSEFIISTPMKYHLFSNHSAVPRTNHMC